MPRQTARRIWLSARIAKQAAADDELSETTCVDPKFRREIDRIDAKAEEESNYQKYAAKRQLDEARSARATAQARLDAAAPKDKRKARIARNDADGAVRRAERAARKAGL
ncbi:hypothetical protein [Streptomyces sp. NPDC046925]|uniref:hypothetical protein n=1 Tax=Streptomyces sp. NPDC046925 TaxID=3155375 RepID=UPI0033E528BB